MTSQTGLATFSVRGYGTRSAWCEGYSRTVKINSSSDEGSTTAAFYLKKVSDQNFSLKLAFRSERELNSFNLWVKVFAEKYAKGEVGAMYVAVPTVGVSVLAVPTSPLSSNIDSKGALQRVSIDFAAGNDPQALQNPVTIPQDENGYTTGPPSTPVIPNFYPTGFQQSAFDRLEAYTYDSAASAASTVIIPSSVPGVASINGEPAVVSTGSGTVALPGVDG